MILISHPNFDGVLWTNFDLKVAKNVFCRTWFTGIRNAENGLGASNKTGPLSIFA